MERTLALIKPDAVQRQLIGEIIKRIEVKGFRIVGMKMVKMSIDQAAHFYAVHQGKPFFQSLITFMSSGPLLAMVLEGEGVIAQWRELMGATDYRQAAPGTIRRDLATDIEKNVVHGSDSPETASFEIGFFFSELELLS